MRDDKTRFLSELARTPDRADESTDVECAWGLCDDTTSVVRSLPRDLIECEIEVGGTSGRLSLRIDAAPCDHVVGLSETGDDQDARPIVPSNERDWDADL